MKDKLRRFYMNGLAGQSPSISFDGIVNAIALKWITADDAAEIIEENTRTDTENMGIGIAGASAQIAGNQIAGDPVRSNELSRLNVLRAVKLKEVSHTCNETIAKGIDIELDGSRFHFSLTTTDQINLATAVKAIDSGANSFPYHSDNGLYRMYSAEELTQIAKAANSFILQQITYCNHLNTWIRRTSSVQELDNIYYGAELPEDLKSSLYEIIEATADLKSDLQSTTVTADSKISSQPTVGFWNWL